MKLILFWQIALILEMAQLPGILMTECCLSQKCISGKVSKIPREKLDKPQVVSSGGLFSSDEESSLFSGVPPAQGQCRDV